MPDPKIGLAPIIAKQLKQLGYRGTIADLKTFQAAKGIRPTGIVDAQTRITLERMARQALENSDQFVASRLNPPPANLGVKPGPQEVPIDPSLSRAIEAFKQKNPELQQNLTRWSGRPVQQPSTQPNAPVVPPKRTA
jgi:hypothetical protein